MLRLNAGSSWTCCLFCTIFAGTIWAQHLPSWTNLTDMQIHLTRHDSSVVDTCKCGHVQQTHMRLPAQASDDSIAGMATLHLNAFACCCKLAPYASRTLALHLCLMHLVPGLSGTSSSKLASDRDNFALHEICKMLIFIRLQHLQRRFCQEPSC